MSCIRKIAVSVAALLTLPLCVMAENGGEAIPAPVGGGSNFLFMMAAMIAIIYFVMIRPEQKRQKQRQKMLSELKKGDKVLTVGGIIGVITSVKDISYVIKSGEGILEVTKSAVQNIITDNKDVAGEEVKAADDSKGSKFGGKENR